MKEDELYEAYSKAHREDLAAVDAYHVARTRLREAQQRKEAAWSAYTNYMERRAAHNT
jgi:hypothetical protein